NNKSDPTPQAIPNMVRKERSLCAHNVAMDWRMMSRSILIEACPQATWGVVRGLGSSLGGGSHVPPRLSARDTLCGAAKFPRMRNIACSLDCLFRERVSRGRLRNQRVTGVHFGNRSPMCGFAYVLTP